MLDHQYIKKLAADAGFDLCGLAPCRHLVENESMLRAWLGKGYQSSLAYMERNVEKRADPRKLVEGARTAVVCAVSYKNRAGEGYPPGHRTKVASYACAADYHTTIKGMLGRMLDALCASRPDLSGRAFVDTAPLLEKQLAVEAGLGWIGRQSLLVTPRFGTYVLLGELLLTDDAAAYDPPFEGSRCGRCHNCIESCPTGAIVAPKVIDTGRCISCHTIEKEPDAHQPGLRPRVRPAGDGRRGMAGDGRNGIRSPHGHDTADPQRTGTHPKQHRQRITPPRQHRWEQHRPGAKRLGSNPHPGEDGSLLHAPHGQPEPARVGVALVDTGARKAEHPCPECIRGRRGA